MTALRTLPLFLATLVIPHVVHAEYVTAISVDATNADSTTIAVLGDANNLINGTHAASLSPAQNSNNTSLTGSWVTFPRPADYFSTGRTPRLVFDLGSVRLLDKAHLWAYTLGGNSPQANSLKDFTLDFSLDNSTFSSPQNFTLAPQVGGTSSFQPVQTFDFSSVVSTQYVRMTLTDNYFGTAGMVGGDRVGFAEIGFNATAVPEPSAVIIFTMTGGAWFIRRRWSTARDEKSPSLV